jgi:AAA15 family ATPase/GTPase
MLTRLHVKGFKNLIDTEVFFGPLTCIAGANGTGKSNLFDAILFLRDLAELPIIEAATRVRDRSARQKGDIRSLFTKTLDGSLRPMEF